MERDEGFGSTLPMTVEEGGASFGPQSEANPSGYFLEASASTESIYGDPAEEAK